MIDVKNSSNKKIGYIEIYKDKIIIHSNTKKDLIISDKDVLDMIFNKNEDVVKILFDNYYLTISEISALFGVSYPTGRKILYKIGFNSNLKDGRRNSSYGAVFSETRLKHMSENAHINHYSTYVRTKEIKEKTSKTLKEKYKNKEIEVNSKAISEAWKNGKYKNAKMGRGIQGYFYSKKNDSDFYFRSLLELYFLIKIEKDENVLFYDFEPFVIDISDKERYIPDCLINNKYLIELKPMGFIKYTDKKRFDREVFAAYNFSVKNNYIFKVVYDVNIGFNSSKFRRYIKNNLDILEEYNIRFKNKL